MATVLSTTDPRTLGGLRTRRETICDIAQRYHATNLRVTGSVARGEATAESDVDLIVDIDVSNLPGLRYFGNLEDLRKALEGELGCEVDVIDFETIRQGLDGGDSPFGNYRRRIANRIIRAAIPL